MYPVDQDLGWWKQVVFGGWRDRTGPRYQRVSAAVLDAVEAGTVRSGSRLPAERLLAGALGVSRGTIVSAFDQLVAAGVARRRQGSGTFVAGRPGWLGEPTTTPAAGLLRRRLAGRASLDLSLSVPPGIDHLPPVDLGDVLHHRVGNGLDPIGSVDLREQVARHLTEHQQLPTSPDQLIITAGAQQALRLILSVAGRRPTVVASCPTYAGLRGAIAGRSARLVAVPGDGPAGADADALGRSARKVDNPIIFAMPTGSNPTGSVMPRIRRDNTLLSAHASGALVIEDLALADLFYGDDPPPPLAADDDTVVTVGSVGKVLWAGLRVGWIRAEEPLRSNLVAAKAAADLATSWPAQRIAATMLAAVDADWLTRTRRALSARRDRMATQLSTKLPAWTLDPSPEAGLSLWPRLPVTNAETFCHTASEHGVVIAAGAVMCHCGRHHDRVRLSFAQRVDELDLGAERLARAWEAHCEDLATSPSVLR